eukprot:SAG11_NODE_131_length_15487_cov_5.744996_3_plen_117_part_00
MNLEMGRFLGAFTPLQRTVMVGFPPHGSAYWDAQTMSGTRARYGGHLGSPTWQPCVQVDSIYLASAVLCVVYVCWDVVHKILEYNCSSDQVDSNKPLNFLKKMMARSCGNRSQRSS